ncbi:MAG: hypothetical protein LUD68_04855 [Rikenellaceae bacterium]|nr:hypothetical protein [Rikenellaceae bacterium]
MSEAEKADYQETLIQYLVYDENGNPTSNHFRMMEIMDYSGSREPKIQGNIRNTFTYNNFSLGLNLSYSFGSRIRLQRLYPNLTRESGSMAPQTEQNVRREMNNRWRRPGDEDHTNVPGILSTHLFSATLSPWWINDSRMTSATFGMNTMSGSIWEMYDFSSARVVNGNYVKIQNISLRYTLPRKFCESINLKSGYVSFTGTNLYTFCSSKLKGQDPNNVSSTSENISHPVQPIYSMTLNVTF